MSRKSKLKMSIIEEKGEGAEAPLNPPLAPSSMDELTAGEILPEVKENAIAAVQGEKSEKIEKAKAEGFNPEIHATNQDGTPKKTQSGKFAKKRGRKSVLNTGEKSAKEEQEELKAAKARAENKQSAVVISGILEQAQIKLISDDFKYSDIERAANQAVWEATLEYYGGVNIPPPVALMVDHMTIILTRAQSEKVQNKFSHFKLWFKNKFKRGHKNALSDNRKDAKRENNVREEEGAEPAETGI